MCGNCGCTDTSLSPPDARVVAVMADLLSANDRQAAANRELFGRHDMLVVNLMSSPGAGKTSLLEATASQLPAHVRCAVIEGDLATENDAERVRRAGLEAVQITTGSACHLDATMIAAALPQLELDELDLLFVENVGNLVCPASFDLGQHLNVTLLSVPEGDDKPAKYPVMFRTADLVLLTKMDLATHLPDFQSQRVHEHLRQLASPAPCLEVSVRQAHGTDGWVRWLLQARDEHRRELAAGRNRRPRIAREAADLAAVHLAGETHGGHD